MAAIQQNTVQKLHAINAALLSASLYADRRKTSLLS
jgi:hypothetical protein